MGNYHRYVILTTGRTGSTILTRLIREHSRVVDYQELFNVNYRAEWTTHSGRAESLRYWLGSVHPAKYNVRPSLMPENLRPEEILERCVWHDGYADRVQAVGFKLLHYQLNQPGDFPGLRKQLAERLPTTRVVLLTRRNLLRLYLSHVVSDRVRQWHITDERQRRPRPRLAVAPEDVVNAFRHYRRSEEELESLAGRARATLRLNYEELITDLGGHWKRLLQFLSLAPETMPRCRLLKIENRTLREALVNYDSLKNHFLGSPWETFFEE